MSTEFYESPQQGAYYQQPESPQWGDLLLGANGRQMRSGCQTDDRCDQNVIIRPGQGRYDYDDGNYSRANYSNYDRNYGRGAQFGIQLGPIQLDFGNGGTRLGLDMHNRGYAYRDNGYSSGRDYGYNSGRDYGNNQGRYADYSQQGRDQYGRPYDTDRYGYEPGGGSWNNGYDRQNHGGQQMQRIYMQLLQQMIQRQRYGQQDRYGQYDQYGRQQDRYGQYDQYGRQQDCYGQYDQYRRQQDRYGQYDQYGRQQGRDQYDPRYQQGRDQYGRPYDRDQYANRGQSEYWGRLAPTIQQMLGRSVTDFDHRASTDRGCVTFISAALRHSFNLNIRDTSCDGLERTLGRSGFERVSLQNLQPGDVIIANRRGNQPGHAAIYAGDGRVAQNSSSQARVSLGNVSYFNPRNFERVVAYRPRV
ncbi:MAG: hypothetical protein IAF58_05615 [Leptolyngbya sp.]|nr:hypothetical protein [Candidatus Melainabacteria bacterium]